MPKQRRWSCSMSYDGKEVGGSAFTVYAPTIMLAVAKWHQKARECDIDPTEVIQLEITEVTE